MHPANSIIQNVLSHMTLETNQYNSCNAQKIRTIDMVKRKRLIAETDYSNQFKTLLNC